MHHVLNSTVYDVSGQGNNGVIYGASKAPSKIGGALSFDGVDDHVQITSPHLMGLSFSAFSVCAWIKIKDTTLTWGCIFERGGWNIGAFGLFKVASERTVRLQAFELTPPGIDTLSSVADDTWHHIVGMYDGSFLRIYVDGVLENSVASTGTISADVEYSHLGARLGNQLWLSGIVDDVRIYSRALSADEIAKIVNSWGI